MIPDETVERVRESADIVSIIGEYVKLKRAGNSYRGPCPFHGGTHNNFSVTPRGGYSCFVCGEKGDVFTFMQKHLGVDFVGAVKLVGEKSGVEVLEVAGRRPDVDPREPLWEINTAAAEFFQSQLADSPLGQGARDYLQSRELTLDDARRFGVGFAPRGDGLSKHLATLGFSDKRQLAAGLLVLPQGKSEALVRFRNRLMFPIEDAAGHVVGFGGRLLGPGEPKYLNSPDSELFSKRTLLYGIHWAKNAIRKSERAFVVEGYFDLIRLVLAGFEEVVAPMGTALTREQATLLKKYSHNVFLMYDSDGAGLRATFRSGDVLLSTGITARVVTLPDGHDPDTYTSKNGAAGVQREIAQSIDIFDRKIQILERSGFFADVRRKREAIDKLLSTIRVTADQLSQDLYIARAAEVSGLSVDAIERELKQLADRESSRVPANAIPKGPRLYGPKNAGKIKPEGYLKERATLGTALYRRDYVDQMAEQLPPDHFRDPAHRQIYEQLIAAPEASADELAARLDENATEILQELLLTGEGLNHDAIARGGIKSLIARNLHEDATKRLEKIKVTGERARWIENKLARVGETIRASWEAPRDAGLDVNQLTIDGLLAEENALLLEHAVQGAKWRALGVQKWRMIPYPAEREAIAEDAGGDRGDSMQGGRAYNARRAAGGSE